MRENPPAECHMKTVLDLQRESDSEARDQTLYAVLEMHVSKGNSANGSASGTQKYT